ncbi:MAG TPA: ATPase, partial [Clostridiales bacterium]|nr:ATPase [Clostridiales bacterium]
MDERHSVDELVTLLGELVNDAWSMPLSGGKVVLERDRLLDLVEEIKAVLPGDLQQARAIVASRN